MPDAIRNCRSISLVMLQLGMNVRLKVSTVVPAGDRRQLAGRQDQAEIIFWQRIRQPSFSLLSRVAW